jgi:DNA polymerase
MKDENWLKGAERCCILQKMKAADKQQLYSLLTVAEGLCRGYSPSGNNCPDFQDDLILEAPLTESGNRLQTIAGKIAVCTRCGLHEHRHKTVPGTGCIKPAVLVIGEGPGADEDMQGEPFVGNAGRLLDKMLASICLSRQANCFITNVVKCRPPQNRDPRPEESDACISFLEAQIHLLKPMLILALGRIAAQNLLQTTDGIGHLRGKFHSYAGIPLLATYHPSALLRNETLKRPAWEDLKLFRSRLEELAPEYAVPFYALSGEQH